MFVCSWHKLQHFPTTVLVGLRTRATLSPGHMLYSQPMVGVSVRAHPSLVIPPEQIHLFLWSVLIALRTNTPLLGMQYELTLCQKPSAMAFIRHC